MLMDCLVYACLILFPACYHQYWRAGWTTLGNWSLLSLSLAFLNSNTAWSGCCHSWERCSRLPCSAPHEGTREQQQLQAPRSMQKKWSLMAPGCKICGLLDRSAHPDMCACCFFVFWKGSFKWNLLLHSASVIWILIWTFMESQQLKSGMNTQSNLKCRRKSFRPDITPMAPVQP